MYGNLSTDPLMGGRHQDGLLNDSFCSPCKLNGQMLCHPNQPYYHGNYCIVLASDHQDLYGSRCKNQRRRGKKLLNPSLLIYDILNTAQNYSDHHKVKGDMKCIGCTRCDQIGHQASWTLYGIGYISLHNDQLERHYYGIVRIRLPHCDQIGKRTNHQGHCGM